MDENILTPDQRIRVFISSTLQELQIERRAVRKAIKDDLKLHPIMFEEGASPHPPRDKYRLWLQQSDIYIGIFSESYGWIAPDMEISGIEDEYLIAKERGLPRLVYVKNTSKGRHERLTQLLKSIEEEATICYKSFDTHEELEELVKNDIALILSERFGITQATLPPQIPENHLARVTDDLIKFGFIDRPELLSEIESAVNSDWRILLFGEPGCGKTFLLGKIGEKTDGIYISIRDKTPLEVYTYLSSHLRVSLSAPPQRYITKEEARFDFEISLQNTTATILVDDVDQNTSLAKSLIGCAYYQNRVIFAARSEEVLGGYPLRQIRVIPFTRLEVEQYLEEKGVKIPPSKFIQLLRTSYGNPLYLYYFVHLQIDPLPDGIKAYQNALWRELDPTQRELLGLIALSIFSIELDLLRHACNNLGEKKYSAMELASILTRISSIVRVINGHYEIFHPYFKEAVVNEIERLGLSQEYHGSLGEVNLSKSRIVEATYHFSKAGDKRAEEHLIEAAHNAQLWGLWDIAEEFMRHQIDIAIEKKDSWTRGYVCYHLAFLLREKGLLKDSVSQTQRAIEAFEACGDKTWADFAKIQQCLDWIWEGKGLIAIESLKKQLTAYQGVDPRGEAMILVNLSYAYIQVSQHEKGAEVAKKAYEIFVEEKDHSGLSASLVNLTACLAHLEKYDLSKDYAEEIIEFAEEFGQPRLKVAGLNHLALCLRKIGDPLTARNFLEEAISICQRLGLLHAEITNILNLGNTYKDENDLDRAEKCYQDGLAKANECNFEKEAGRALELIASIKILQGEEEGAIALLTEAIEIQTKVGDSLRIAESLTERAVALSALNRNQEATNDYKKAGDHYKAISYSDNCITSYERAACHAARLNDEANALDALEQAIEVAFSSDKIDRAISAAKTVQDEKKISGLDNVYITTIEKYVKTPSKANLSLLLYSFASYCKVSDNREIRNSYIKVLNILSTHAFEHQNICNSLIAGLEQADVKLLMEEEFENIVFSLTDSMDCLYYRKMPDGVTVWNLVWRLEKPVFFQIQSLSEHLTVKRLSLIFMLTLLANQELFCQNIEQLSGFKSNSICFMLLEQKDFEEKIQKLPDGVMAAETPGVFMQSNVPFSEEQPPIPIIIHSDYSVLADWSIYPENKALVWLIMNFYRTIIENFTHTRADRELARKAREFCEVIFGYKEIDTDASEDAHAQWEVEDIKSVLERLHTDS